MLLMRNTMDKILSIVAQAITLAFWTASMVVICWTVVSGQPSSLSVENTAKQLAPDRWEWTAYIVGPPSELNRIKCVIYVLHPTFPDPIRPMCSTKDPKYPFALTTNGWGTFDLIARIEFKDGTVRELVHPLQF
jgi:transcription initiation factor IIF auxiliary subunit